MQETRDSDRLHELPATLHGLVAARLDALDTGRALAARGLRDRRRQRSDRGGARARRPRRRAAGCSTASPNATSSRIEHDDFHFKSELIREIAYGTLTKAERARRHARGRARPRGARRAGRSTRPRIISPTAAELVDELGTVDGVPDDVRRQAIDTLMRAADRDESVESWLMAERHHDRALALLGPENTEARRDRAARAGARPACTAACSTTPATTR